MNTLAYRLKNLSVKSLQVIIEATGNQPVINHNFFINSIGTSFSELGL
ncbi:hypothetical protein [Mucilaginibacter kameinonensis]|nr:hypothetical protein [Mucilaginibacter kameinonensis]